MNIFAVLGSLMFISKFCCCWEVKITDLIARMTQEILQRTNYHDYYQEYNKNVLLGIYPGPLGIRWADESKYFGDQLYNQFHYVNITYNPQLIFKPMDQIERRQNIINLLERLEPTVLNFKHGFHGDQQNQPVTFIQFYSIPLMASLLVKIHNPTNCIRLVNKQFPDSQNQGRFFNITYQDKSGQFHQTTLYHFLNEMPLITITNQNRSRVSYSSDISDLQIRQLSELLLNEYTDLFNSPIFNTMEINYKQCAIQSHQIGRKFYDYFLQRDNRTITYSDFVDHFQPLVQRQWVLAALRLSNWIKKVNHARLLVGGLHIHVGGYYIVTSLAVTVNFLKQLVWGTQKIYPQTFDLGLEGRRNSVQILQEQKTLSQYNVANFDKFVIRLR